MLSKSVQEHRRFGRDDSIRARCTKNSWNNSWIVFPPEACSIFISTNIFGYLHNLFKSHSISTSGNSTWRRVNRHRSDSCCKFRDYYGSRSNAFAVFASCIKLHHLQINETDLISRSMIYFRNFNVRDDRWKPQAVNHTAYKGTTTDSKY
jgi:hypothetical protein